MSGNVLDDYDDDTGTPDTVLFALDDDGKTVTGGAAGVNVTLAAGERPRRP